MLMRSHRNQPKVSIVLPVFNGEKTLVACLDSLMALDFPKEDLEIIVVDNNSTDATKEIIQRYPVCYVFEANKGRGYARNAGVKNANGEFIAFIDADCIATENWLKVLYERINRDDNLAACGGEIFAFKKETIFERYLEDEGILCQRIGYEGRNKWDFSRIVTANAIFRKRAIKEAGGFDDDLVTSEDTDISWRICFLGRYAFDYAPEAVVYHQHIPTFLEFCKHHFEYGWAAAVMKRKYSLFRFKFTYPADSLKRSFFIAKLFFHYSFHVLKFMFLTPPKKCLSLWFASTVCLISNTAGEFLSVAAMIFANSKAKSDNTSTWDGFKKDFVAYGDGVKWSSPRPMTWFDARGTVQLVVFSDEMPSYRLNEIGSQIWLCLVKTQSVKKTIDQLAQHYNVDLNVLKNDVENFLNMLYKEEVLKREKNNMVLRPNVFVEEAYA